MMDEIEGCEYEFGDSKPSWYYEGAAEQIVKTKAEIRAFTKSDKAQQTLIAKRKQFCDEILKNAHRIFEPDPAYLRKHVQIIIDAGYRDGCLNPKEFGIVLWGAKYLRTPRSRKILEGLVQLGPDTDYWFSRSCIEGDYMFQQITRYMPESYIPRARYCRCMTQRELEILNERALGR